MIKRIKKIKVTAEELLSRYGAGERNFSGIYFRGESLDNADLRDINLSGSDLGDTELCNVNLSKANLSGSSLCEVSWEKVNFSYAQLRGAVLDNISLFKCNFTKANLNEANLIESWVEGCNFDGATLTGAMLGLATFTKVSCRNATFDGAYFAGENCFENSDLTGASFKACDFIFPEHIPPNAPYYLILPDGRILGNIPQ